MQVWKHNNYGFWVRCNFMTWELAAEHQPNLRSYALFQCSGGYLPFVVHFVELWTHIILKVSGNEQTQKNLSFLFRVTNLKCCKCDWKIKQLLSVVFSPREELRLGPGQPGSSYKCCPVSNGTAGRRPTLIEPERLKDFGEEELLNGDVKVFETKVVGCAEITLMDPPKTRRVSEFRAVPKPQYLRFEDISAAAFRIQTGIQKTPCTVH